MKKLTNNTGLGKIVLLCNVLVLFLFIISMISLLKFDKTNNAVIAERNTYNFLYEGYVTAQHPLRQDSAEVAYYQYKLDTLQQRNPTTKDEKAALKDQIEVTKQTLADKQKQQEEHLAALANYEQKYVPENEKWTNLNNDNQSAKKSFWLLACITIIAFLVKTFLMAMWGAKNNKNLHQIAPWMKDGMKPWMAYVAWFVPVYNLIKPLSFYKEIWNETDYSLENAGIITRKEDAVDNSNIYMSIWWAFLLCSVWLMNIILFATFFREGALFVKANHSVIAMTSIAIMVITILIETYIILKYNKMNLKLVENEDKF